MISAQKAHCDRLDVKSDTWQSQQFPHWLKFVESHKMEIFFCSCHPLHRQIMSWSNTPNYETVNPTCTNRAIPLLYSCIFQNYAADSPLLHHRRYRQIPTFVMPPRLLDLLPVLRLATIKFRHGLTNLTQTLSLPCSSIDHWLWSTFILMSSLLRLTTMGLLGLSPTHRHGLSFINHRL